MYIYIDVLSACVGRRIERWSCRSPHSTNLKESQHEYHVPSQSVGAVRGTPQSNDVGQAPAWERERQQCHGFPQTFSLDFFLGTSAIGLSAMNPPTAQDSVFVQLHGMVPQW